MPITLYDLAGAEADRRFSPFCWRTRMALAHKGLDVETVPWCFTEKDRLPQPNAGRVPVIVDGDRVVHDSTAIADYLEQTYPDRPSLFGDEIGRALARFVQNWTETVLLAGLVRLVVRDIQARLPAFRASLDPLRRTVERQDFISGKTPAYADYVVFGAFQWARAISDFEVLPADHPVRIWRGRMLDLFGGLARRAPGYGD